MLNRDIYKLHAPTLDSLLVFVSMTPLMRRRPSRPSISRRSSHFRLCLRRFQAGLFPAILAAFVIEIGKGLQEDLLLRILHELERSNAAVTLFVPVQTSVWVHDLWFSSLVSSLMGALGIMVTKTFCGRWVIEPEDVDRTIEQEMQQFRRRNTEDQQEQLVSAEAGMRVQQSTFHWSTFRAKLRLLVAFVSVLIYFAFILFFAGLVVLLFGDRKPIALAILVLTLVLGAGFLGIVLHDVLMLTGWPGNHLFFFL